MENKLTCTVNGWEVYGWKIVDNPRVRDGVMTLNVKCPTCGSISWVSQGPRTFTTQNCKKCKTTVSFNIGDTVHGLKILDMKRVINEETGHFVTHVKIRFRRKLIWLYTSRLKSYGDQLRKPAKLLESSLDQQGLRVINQSKKNHYIVTGTRGGVKLEASYYAITMLSLDTEKGILRGFKKGTKWAKKTKQET